MTTRKTFRPRAPGRKKELVDVLFCFEAWIFVMESAIGAPVTAVLFGFSRNDLMISEWDPR